MKTLHLIRHAKSSWEDPSLSDRQRPLKTRGYNDCELMAGVLKGKPKIWERICSSPAQRAVMTIETLSKQANINAQWQVDETLYTFNASELLSWWQQQNDVFNHITLVGHNPALTDLIEHLCGENISNFPTCGYAQLQFTGHHWANLSADSCQLVTYTTPKQLKTAAIQ